MFRTKSLTSQEMKNLIQRNRPSQIQKQNRNFSLRTLIADKTIKYHKHMQKLIQESSNIVYSGQKSQKKTPRGVLGQMSKQGERQHNSQVVEQQYMDEEMISQILVKPIQTKQFQSDISIVYVESLPTYQNQKIITEQNQENRYSCMSRSKKNSMDRSAFKISLENQQLMEENKQLRRQIQHLQQRLQTSQLIKIQKQSEAESLKLKIKIYELKIQDFQEREQQAMSYYTKFTHFRPKGISIQPKIFAHAQTETIQSMNSMKQLEQLTQSQQRMLINLKQQVCQLQKFLYKTVNMFSVKKQQLLGSSNQDKKIYKSMMEKTSELIRKQREADKQNIQKEILKNKSLENQMEELVTKYNDVLKINREYQINLQESCKEVKKLQQFLDEGNKHYCEIQYRLELQGRRNIQLEQKIVEDQAQLQRIRIQIQHNVETIAIQKQKHRTLEQELSKVIEQYQYEYSLITKQLNQRKQEWLNNTEQISHQLKNKDDECRYLETQNRKLSENVRNITQKLQKLQFSYEKKVGNLVNLLNLAQIQIRSLLTKLRQAKDHDVANYKEMIAQFVGKVQAFQFNGYHDKQKYLLNIQ